MAFNPSTDLLIRIVAKNEAGAPLKQLEGQIQGVASSAANAGKAIAVGLTAAVAAAAVVIKLTTDSARQWGRELDNLINTLGVSGEQAAAYNYQLKIVGASNEDLITATGTLSSKLFEQLPLLAKGTSDFQKWGIAVMDSNGALLDSTEILENVRKKIQQLGPGQAARALERDLFGRAGGTLHNFLSLTDADIKQMDQDMRAMGIVVTSGGVDAMKQMERELNKVGMIFDILKVQVGSFLIPILVNLARHVMPMVSGAFKVVGEAMRVPLSILKDLFERFRVFASDLKEKGVWNAIVGLATDLMSKVGGILGNAQEWVALNAPKWIDALAQLIGEATQYAVDHPGEVIAAIFDFAKNAGTLIANAIGFMNRLGMALGLVAGIVGLTIGQVILNKLIDALNSGIEKINATLGKVLGFSIPLIAHVDFQSNIKALEAEIARLLAPASKVVNIIFQTQGGLPFGPALVSGPQEGAPGVGAAPGGTVFVPGVGTVSQYERGNAQACESRPGYQWNWSDHTCFYAGGAGGGASLVPFASGGIVTSPTAALLGERGPEAVVPLGRGGGMGGVTVNLNVGSVDSNERVRELSRAVAGELMRISRATGNWSF